MFTEHFTAIEEWKRVHILQLFSIVEAYISLFATKPFYSLLNSTELIKYFKL